MNRPFIQSIIIVKLKNCSFIFSVQNYTFFLTGENFSPAYFFLLHSLCKLKYITDSLHTAFILYTFASDNKTTCEANIRNLRIICTENEL